MFDMFDVSEETYDNRIEAVKEFTDREDPQEAFERKYQVLYANRKKTYYVLCYYGIGGVGKTSFVEKLCRMIDKVPNNECRVVDNIDCHYAYHSFESDSTGKDILSILLALRKKIGKANPKFGFYRFDAALLSYANKEEIDLSIGKENACIIEANPWLKTTFAIGGLTPAGWVFDAIETLETISGIVKDRFKRHISQDEYKTHLEYVNGLDSRNLLKELPRFFILDMRENMLKIADKPLVIFLDAYERYMNSFESDGIKGTQDYWLRKGHAQSVIRSIPGIMWVITGREKLTWSDDDNWGTEQPEKPLGELSEEEKNTLSEQHLEQHLIGDLSKKDACSFLEKAGVCDETLRNQLYIMSNGTPLFLDISVDLYFDIVNNGKVPKISDFGRDYSELIVRYMQHLPLYARELICFFSCIGKWSSESLAQILSKTSTPVEHWERRYKEFLQHSFVIQGKNNDYYIHDTVKKAAYELADPATKRAVRNAQIDSFEENNKTNDRTVEYSERATVYINALYDEYATYEEILEKQTIVQKILHDLEQRGDYYTYLRIAKTVAQKNAETLGVRHNDSIAAIVSLATAYSFAGNKKQALELRKRVHSIRKELLGEEHFLTLQALHALGISYYETGQLNRALEIRQTTYAKNKELLGENHSATLSSLHALSLSYYSVGDNEKALSIREAVYAKRKVLLGETHSDTLWTLHNLAISYSKVGKIQEAFAIRKKVYETRKELLGTNHPDTLWSLYALADSFSQLGEKDKALALRKSIYLVRKQILGSEHPDSLTSLYSIAKSYHESNMQQEASDTMKDVYEKRKEILGADHPDTIKAYNFLSQLNVTQ